MKPEAIAVGAPQDGRWKNNLNFYLFYAYPYIHKESMDDGFTYSDLAMYAAADDTPMTSLVISDHVLLWRKAGLGYY